MRKRRNPPPCLKACPPLEKASGFTIVEMLVALAIIGILILLSMKAYLWILDMSKQSRTMADIKTIGNVLNSFFIDHSYYPKPEDYDSNEESPMVPVSSLKDDLEPLYIAHLPTLDGWGNPLHYRHLTCFYGEGEEEKDTGSRKDDTWKNPHWSEVAPYPTVGRCLSTEIKENCSDLSGEAREECVHEQQDYCKSLNYLEGNESFQVFSFGRDNLNDVEEPFDSNMDQDIVFQGNQFISYPVR